MTIDNFSSILYSKETTHAGRQEVSGRVRSSSRPSNAPWRIGWSESSRVWFRSGCEIQIRRSFCRIAPNNNKDNRVSLTTALQGTLLELIEPSDFIVFSFIILMHPTGLTFFLSSSFIATRLEVYYGQINGIKYTLKEKVITTSNVVNDFGFPIQTMKVPYFDSKMCK